MGRWGGRGAGGGASHLNQSSHPHSHSIFSSTPAPPARKIHTNPEIEAANLNNVLSFNSPTKKKKKKKKKKKSSPKGAKKHAFFVSDDVSDYESDSSEEEPQKNPMAALLAGRMATSPTSKKQLLKETAKRNAERKAAREQLKDAPALADIWELVSEAGVSFYVNALTGEATEEDPFDSSPKKFEDLLICQPRLDMDVLSPPIATGHRAYEELRPEFHKVMDFLDGNSKTYE